MHLFMTREELIQANNLKVEELNKQLYGERIMRARNIDEVRFCPHCSHDF